MKEYYRTGLLFICTFFFSQYLGAQTTSKADSLKSRLVDTICVSITKADSNTVNTMADAQRVISNAFTGGVMDLYTSYIEATGFDVSKLTEEKLVEVTNYIASEVDSNCPRMKLLIIRVNRQK